MQLLEVFLEGKKKSMTQDSLAPLDSSYDRHIPGERV